MNEGEFYDKNGNKIGEDECGKDGNRYVVKDESEAEQIKKQWDNGEGTVIDLAKVKSDVKLPNDITLNESLDVLERTEDNGGLREETSKVMSDGTVVRGMTGEMPKIVDGVQTAKTHLPPTISTEVEATIHSHPTEVQIEGEKAYPQSAREPSDADRTTFKNYETNIIVGRLGRTTVTKNLDGSYSKMYTTKGAVIYNNKTQVQIELTEKAIKNILK